MFSRRFLAPLIACTVLVSPSAASAAVVGFPPAIGGFDYQACFAKFANTGLVAGDGIYINSYVASGQASNMTMGGRLDNYHCLVGSPTHYGNVRFSVNVFALTGWSLGPLLASYDVFMQTLMPKFIVDGPSVGRVQTWFSTKVPIYSDPSSDLGWTATVVDGALPRGLAVTGNGEISGVPRQAGRFSFTLAYTTSAVPWQNAARPRYRTSLVIAKPLTVVPDALANAVVGRRYRARLAGARGEAPYSFARVRGALPPGLTLWRTGSITGTPRRAGKYRVVVAVTDAVGERGRDTVLLTVRR